MPPTARLLHVGQSVSKPGMVSMCVSVGAQLFQPFEAFYTAYSRSKHFTQRTAVLSNNLQFSLSEIQNFSTGSPCLLHPKGGEAIFTFWPGNDVISQSQVEYRQPKE